MPTRFVLLAALLLLASALPALASTINGSLWIFPDADYASGNITYNAPVGSNSWGSALAPQASGDFASVFAGLKLPGDYSGGSTFTGDVLTMAVTGVPISLGTLGANSDFWLTEYSGGYPTGNMAQMTILSANYVPTGSLPAGVAAGVSGDARMTLTGFAATVGHFTLEVQVGNFWDYNGEYYNNWTSLNWTDPPSPVPGPLAGGGLVGAAFGLFGLAAYRIRRRFGLRQA